jgi:signal transduction histidine kinase/DNA-binding response OmpR family regulator
MIHRLDNHPIQVLLIEDNEDDYVFTRELLTDVHTPQYQLAWVSTYEAAWTAIVAQQYDIYLLDYRLGEQDGLELLRQVRKLPHRVAIILLSGVADRSIDLEAMELGAIDFLYKAEITVSTLERSLRYAMRQKQAEDALQAQAERERLIREISQHIRGSLDLDAILNAAVAEVRQFLTVDRVVVYCLNPDLSGQIVVESVSSPQLSILGCTIQDTCFQNHWHEPYRQGRISAIENVATSPIQPCHAKLLTRLQVQANLVFPLLQGDTLWGLLIAHQCTAPRKWQPSEIDLLNQVASQLAIAIQQSELYQQIQELNTNLEQQVRQRTIQLQEAFDFEATLKRITDKVRDSLDERQILQTAVEELVMALDAEACDIGWYDFEQQTITVNYEAVRANIPAAIGCTAPIAQLPEVHAHTLQGKSVQFCLASAMHLALRGENNWFSILAAPMSNEQGVFGNLWMFKPARHGFSEIEVRLIQQVANQCAIALRQARLYEAAQAQVEELERLNRLKDDFLNTVSHELRTPMANIKMATQMLEIVLKQAGILGTEAGPADRYFQILQDECRREINLINDLLDLARLDAEVEPLNLMEVELQTFIPHVAEPFLERSRTQQQQLEIHLPADLPPLVTSFDGIERVLTELLNNACKYTPPHQKIVITVQPTSDAIQIHILNTGVEIPEPERDRVFDRFYRIPSNDPWKYGGTGLGLALVKKLVEYLGGSIWVESASQQTCFVVELPKREGEVREWGVGSRE